MRQGFIAAAVFAAGFALLSPAQAAGYPKIGVFNLQEVINKSHRGQIATDQLRKIIADLQAQLDDRKKKLLDVKTQLDKADAKSPDYQKLLKSYEDGQSEIQQFTNMSQQDINQRQQDLLGPIQQELGTVLDKFARVNHYDIVMTRSVQGVVFVSDPYDVTAALTDAMDKDWEELQKATPAAATAKTPAASTRH